VNSNHLGLCFSDITFDLDLRKLVPITFLGRKKMMGFSRWWKKGE
jgi:hypothetical protein